jgi:hypothetical protein
MNDIIIGMELAEAPRHAGCGAFLSYFQALSYLDNKVGC